MTEQITDPRDLFGSEDEFRKFAADYLDGLRAVNNDPRQIRRAAAVCGCGVDIQDRDEASMTVTPVLCQDHASDELAENMHYLVRFIYDRWIEWALAERDKEKTEDKDND